MTNIGMERMRLQSHQQIRRFLQLHEQQQRILSKKVDRQKTCRFNANSAFLRCAVNPSGCCSDCQYYEPQED